MGYQVRLTIDGVDESTKLRETSWSVERRAFSALESATFILDNSADITTALTLTRGKEVIFENFADSGDRKFGGILTEVTESIEGLSTVLTCKALGWAYRLSRAVITEQWRGKSDQYIITESVASPKGIFFHDDLNDEVTGFTVSTANIKEGRADTEFFRAEGRSLKDIMDEMAKAAGFVWYIDPDKIVYYRTPGEEEMAFCLSDAPDDVTLFPYRRFSRHIDLSKLVNHVNVRGGLKRELAETQIFPSDGNQLQWNPGRWNPESGQTKIRIDHNTGTDGTPVWTADVVGIDGVDTLGSGGITVVQNIISNQITFDTAPGVFATNGWRLRGDRMTSLVTDALDQSSVDEFGTYTIDIKDPSLVSDLEVQNRADAELSARAGEFERIECFTTKDDIEVGKLIRFVNGTLSIDDRFLVDRMVTRPLGGTVVEYELSLRGV